MYNSPVVIFDGVCNLCNGYIVFLMKHEKQPVLKFTPLQTEQAKKLLSKLEHNPKAFNSVAFVYQNKIFYKSKAVFEIVRYLKRPYSWFGVFKILPLFITDGIYNLVANNRYRIFGRKKVCMTPDESMKGRFL